MISKRIISCFLVLVIISPFIVKEGSNNELFSENENFNNTVTVNSLGDTIGDFGILAQETTIEFTLDGNLSDWESEGIESEIFSGVEVYLAFDTNYVYVGLEWEDQSYNNKFGFWNKTGMRDEDDARWDYIEGSDDVALVGFSPSDNLSKGDLWLWTASNRTQNEYAYECDVYFNPDTGLTPFLFNCNETYAHYYSSKPLYDNDWNPIVDYSTIPNGTLIDGWYNKSSITSTDSQNDVAMNWTRTNERYVVEFKRELDTTNSDDYVLDFTGEELTFYLEIFNGDDADKIYFDFYDKYQISLTNEPAALTFDTLSSSISEALLIKGDIYDDFQDCEILISCSGWDDTYGTGTLFHATINDITGEWNFLFFYDEYDMPLGTNNITVTFDPMYEDPIILWQEIDFEDNRPPNIYGITDISEQYPDGVPLDINKTWVTIGIDDNYFSTQDLTANLYYYKNNDVAKMIEMVHVSAGGRTFTCQIPIEHDKETVNIYHYFVQVYDGELNKAVTAKYNFSVIAGVYTEYLTGTENTHVVPLPTLEIILGTLILAVVIRKLAIRSRNN